MQSGRDDDRADEERWRRTPRTKTISPIGSVALASLISASLSRKASCAATIATIRADLACHSRSVPGVPRAVDAWPPSEALAWPRHPPLPVEGVEAGRDQHRAAGKSERIRPCVENRYLKNDCPEQDGIAEGRDDGDFAMAHRQSDADEAGSEEHSRHAAIDDRSGTQRLPRPGIGAWQGRAGSLRAARSPTRRVDAWTAAGRARRGRAG